MATTNINPKGGETSTKHGLRSKARKAFNTQPVEAIVWLPRTVPMTTAVLALLCIIQGLTELGDMTTIRATWGFDPAYPHSWLTYAFVHDGRAHLIHNTLLILLPAGRIIELHLGRTRLALLILFTAIAAAVMLAVAVPEYWETGGNPVGLSAVSHAIFVIGVYIGARITFTQLATTLASKPGFGAIRGGPWPALATPLGLTAAGTWITVAMEYEWPNQDAAERVAHSFGILAGAMAAVLIATTSDKVRARHAGRALIGFAIAVTLSFILVATMTVSATPVGPEAGG